MHLRHGALALTLRRQRPDLDEIDCRCFIASNPTSGVCNETSMSAMRYMVRHHQVVHRHRLTIQGDDRLPAPGQAVSVRLGDELLFLRT